MGRIGTLVKENGWWIASQHLGGTLWKKIYNRLMSRSLKCAGGLNIHPSAYVRGAGFISVGQNFYAGRQLWLEAVTSHGGRSFTPRITIGDNVAVNDSVHIAATNSVRIGSNVLMASKIYISDHNHGSYRGEEQSDPATPPTARPVTCDQEVVIEDNVWLGEFVSVLAGVTIGEGSIIGSNSVVSRSIPPHSIAAGSPARVIKAYNPEAKKWVSVPQS
jgi:acetyltransferase-like isoleucine patch superfamily enzyme